MEEGLSNSSIQLMGYSKFFRNDPDIKRIRGLFNNFKNMKLIALHQIIRYGSFNELGGGFSSRLFQPSIVDSHRINESHININCDDNERDHDKTLDIDIANYRTIPITERDNIIDIPDSLGYVYIKGSSKILHKTMKYKGHRSPLKNIQNQLLTKDKKYLSSPKFQEKPDKNNKRRKFSEEMMAEVFKTILQEDSYVGYSEKKTNSLLENNYKWSEQPQKFWTVKVNKVRLLRTSWWPKNAQEWKTRSRQWPSQNLVDRVSRFVFLKPAKGEKRFKYWFSHIERILTGLRTREQKLNYLLLKIIFYRYLKPISHDHLHTFQIKSIMMFTCERFPPNHPVWMEINQDKDIMLREMLSQLLQAFERDHLPNYFLTQVNVLKNISKPVRRKVVETLKQILETDNILRLLPTQDIENVVLFLERVKSVFNKVNKFIKKTLKVGVLNTIAEHPQLWLRFGKQQVTKKVRKSNIFTKLVLILSITFAILLFGFIIYIIWKRIFWK